MRIIQIVVPDKLLVFIFKFSFLINFFANLHTHSLDDFLNILQIVVLSFGCGGDQSGQCGGHGECGQGDQSGQNRHISQVLGMVRSIRVIRVGRVDDIRLYD